MQLEFDLTRDDYAALTFARSPSTTVTRLRWLVLAALLTLVAALMGLLTFLTGGTAWVDDAPLLRPLLYLIGGALGAFAVVSALVAALRIWVRRLPRDDGATLGRHQIELEEAGFHVEGRSGARVRALERRGRGARGRSPRLLVRGPDDGLRDPEACVCHRGRLRALRGIRSPSRHRSGEVAACDSPIARRLLPRSAHPALETHCACW
jgi:hypothetical protein